MALQRVLEPEVMDTEDEALAYDAMDHAQVNRAFVDRFLELGGAGLVLDVGTGSAQQPVELAARDASCAIIAIDAARHMLRYGVRNVQSSGFADRILLVRTDAKRLPFADSTFDAVMSNSIVHHLPDPGPALCEMRRVIKPAGPILLRDLVRPPDAFRLDHLVATYAADADERQRGLFRDSLHASFTVDEVRDLLRAAGLDDLVLTMSSDRHWTAERS